MKRKPRLRRLTRFRRFFTDNLGLKIIALLASVALFSIAHGSEDAQRSIFVDVVAILPPPSSGKILVSDLPDQVKVTLRGSRAQIYEMRRSDLPPIQVDLTDTNRSYYYFDPAAFDLPVGVTIVQLAPSTVPLKWAEALQRDLPVSARSRGTPADGLALREPVEITPSKLRVRGPEGEVSTLTTVYTESLDIEGLKRGRHEERVPVEQPAPHVTFIQDPVVHVRFEIVPELAERTFERLEVATLGDARVRMRPDHVHVTVRGPAKAIAGLEPDFLVPVVDPGQLEAGSGAQSLAVNLRGVPEGVTVERIEPAELLVRSVAP